MVTVHITTDVLPLWMYSKVFSGGGAEGRGNGGMGGVMLGEEQCVFILSHSDDLGSIRAPPIER